MEITSSEFKQHVGRYQDAAQHGPVAITKNGRTHTVLVSAVLFDMMLNGRIARPVDDLDAVTHSPPANPADAVEMPAAVKMHLGLDGERSWIVVTETNDFLWPGSDLHPVPNARPARFDYGMLPPRFFAHVRDRILPAHLARRLVQVARSE